MSSQYDFFTRQYPYPLSKVPFPGGTFAKLFIPGDPLDLIPDEENFYILCATPDQVNAIQSSIEIGAPIAFSDSYNEIIQVFDQAVEFPNSFGGASCVDLCNLIIECINDPESGVADAISNITLNQSASEYRDYGQSQNQNNLASGTNGACNPDITWAQCYQLVEYFHEINLEIFAQLEVATNDYELLSDVVGNITGIDETSIDAILAWGEFILDNISENYLAQATIAYREELACEIFCLVVGANCQITPAIGFDVLRDRLSSAVTIESLISESLEYVFTGSWSGSEIADVMFFSQFSFRSMLGLILRQVGYNDTIQRMVIAVNDANNDWQALCACSNVWTAVLDLTSDDYGFTFVDGEWQNGVGFVPTANTGNDNRLYATLVLDNADFTYVSWDATITIPSNPNGDSVAGISLKENSVNTYSKAWTYASLGNGTHNLNFVDTGPTFEADFIDLFLRPDNNGSSGSGIVSRLELRGTGTKPSQLP